MRQTIEKNGIDPNCSHEYVYSSLVVMTFPPINHKICKLCGQVVEEQDEIRPIQSFEDLYNKFHNQGETKNE